ncbi:POTRA domain-containing protein, partial [Methylobacterium oryzihabitans]|uniref:POTRA domain-containing protein n=1 Tax=Methylobacterium oryzihabitans TaxID=2499852 RepID=UPI002482A5C5
MTRPGEWTPPPIRPPRRARAALALALAALPLAGPARAQTASQITPPSFGPPLQRSGGALAIPDGVGPAAPPGAERLAVRVGRLRVEGLPPGRGERPAALARDLAARLSGQTVAVADLFAAARDLEQAYAGEGFALVRVVLPAQQLRDGGDVRLLVVDGLVERVDAAALPPEIRGRVEAVLAPLVGRPGLTLAEIERRVLLAGDTPGTVLRSILAAGAQPGATVLVVEARYKPVTGLVSTDNVLAQSLGTYTLGTGLDLNSPTGHGETLYFRASGAPYSGGERSFFAQEPRNRA